MNLLKRLETEKISKLLLELSIPSILSMLLYAFYNIVDRMFIGRGLGAYAMTGLSICLPIFTVYIAFSTLIGQGGGSVLSIRLGEGDKEGAHKALGNSFTLFALASLFLSIFGSIFIDKILIIFGATDITLPYAKEYIYVINSFVFFSFAALGVNNLVRSEGNSKLIMKRMLIGAIINIALDPILIFYFDMGIKGAAYATILANVVVGSLNINHFVFGSKCNVRLRAKDLILDAKTVKMILSIGASPFSLQLTTSLATILCNQSLLLRGGDFAVGVMGIINTVYLFISVTIAGISSGSQPIIGYNYGAKRYDRVLETLKLSISVAVAIGLALMIAILTLPDMVVNLFNDGNSQILELGQRGLRIYFLLIPLNCFYIIGANYFQFINSSMKSVVLNLLRQVVLLIPLLFILPKYFDIDGIWMVFPISDFIIFLITGFLIKKHMNYLIEKNPIISAYNY